MRIGHLQDEAAIRLPGLEFDHQHCLVPGLMDTIKPRRIKDGSTTEVPGRVA